MWVNLWFSGGYVVVNRWVCGDSLVGMWWFIGGYVVIHWWVGGGS